jgi:hypothetical protein
LIEKDYIMRLIKQLAIALAKIIFNKEIKNYDQAHREVDNSLNSLLGLDRNKIAIMTDDELIDYLEKIDGEKDEKYFVLAELLREEGEICELGNKGDFVTLFYYEKAFRFYLDAFRIEILRTGKNLIKLKFVAEKLLANEMYENRVLPKWIWYYEYLGKYSKAEDILFHLLEDGCAGIQNEGQNFYERLLQKSDDELKNGGLSRNEIRESLAAMEKYWDSKISN